MTDSKSRCVVEILTDTRPIVYLTIDRPSTDCRPTVDRLSTDYRPTIDRLSTNYRPTVDRLSTDYRSLYQPLYWPLCRPISRSTLPTVNKILLIYRLKLRMHGTYVNMQLRTAMFGPPLKMKGTHRTGNAHHMCFNYLSRETSVKHRIEERLRAW